MNLGKTYKSAEGKVGGGGRPDQGGYEMVIRKAEDTTSKKGNSMLVLYADIASGSSKDFFANNLARDYFVYDNEFGANKLKGLLNIIVAENEGMFSQEEVDSGVFEESKLVGLKFGGILLNNDKGYLSMAYYNTIEKALKYELSEKQKVSKPAVSNSGGDTTDDGTDLPF